MLGAEGRDHRDRADHRTPTPEHPWRDQSGDREPAPKEPAPAIPPRQPLLPDPLDLIGVPAYSSKGQTQMLEVPKVDAMSVIMLLVAIEAAYSGKKWIHVFLDNASYHHAILVREWL